MNITQAYLYRDKLKLWYFKVISDIDFENTNCIQYPSFINKLVVLIPYYPWISASKACTNTVCMTLSNGKIYSALMAICAGNSLVTDEFPAQRPVTQCFDVFFDLRLNKRLSKQWWGLWFETPSRPSWRHCNAWSPCPLKLFLNPTVADILQLPWFTEYTPISQFLIHN